MDKHEHNLKNVSLKYQQFPLGVSDTKFRESLQFLSPDLIENVKNRARLLYEIIQNRQYTTTKTQIGANRKKSYGQLGERTTT